MASNTEYKIRPTFKQKFRSAEAKPLIEKVIQDTLALGDKVTGPVPKLIADSVTQELQGLKKDQRYKFIVQCTVGENNG